jgi:hypothetical protein
MGLNRSPALQMLTVFERAEARAIWWRGAGCEPFAIKERARAAHVEVRFEEDDVTRLDASAEEIAAVFGPAWPIVSSDSAKAMRLPGPLRKANPTWQVLRPDSGTEGSRGSPGPTDPPRGTRATVKASGHRTGVPVR